MTSEQEFKEMRNAFKNYFAALATDEEVKKVERVREQNRVLEHNKRINKMRNDRVRSEKKAKVGKTASVEDILGFNV